MRPIPVYEEGAYHSGVTTWISDKNQVIFVKGQLVEIRTLFNLEMNSQNAPVDN